MTIRLPDPLFPMIRDAVRFTIDSRPPDRIIGGADNPYMLRWYLTPRGLNGNAYVHEFRRSDDDRALHDHPWESCSIILDGRYFEHSIEAGGIHVRRLRNPGDIVFRQAEAAHRVELLPADCAEGRYPRTLFLTGATVREWGFHCPERGWVHWRDFTNERDGGDTIGAGCDAEESTYTGRPGQ